MNFNTVIILKFIGTICGALSQFTPSQHVCMVGAPGMPGPVGRDGRDGRDGQTIIGPKGDRGASGKPGYKGSTGSCECPPKNIKQCSWRNINLQKNVGVIKYCDFEKTRNDSWLRAVWSGDLRVYSTDMVRCSRWYMTFNGAECDGPHPIDAIVTASKTIQNDHRPTTLEGLCGNLAQGPVRVALHVGQCDTIPLGDAHTGWISTSRLILEEVAVIT